MSKWVAVGCLTTAAILWPLGKAVSAQGYPEVIAQSASNAPLAALLGRVCGDFVQMSPATLQRLESDQDALARADRSVLCAQLVLYLHDSDAPIIAPRSASEGSRYSNIVATSLELLAHHDADSTVAEMLALVISGEARVPQAAAVANALRHHPGPVDSPAAAAVEIGCVYAAIPVDSFALADACARRGLAAGHDSTYNLLALSRIAGLAADTSRSVAALEGAIQAAHSPLADSLLAWHLRWFATPTEWEAADSAPGRAGMLLNRALAQRDLNEGRTLGATWVEHVRRLQYADRHFRIHARHRDAARFRVAASNFAATRHDAMRTIGAWYDPAVIAAQPFRENKRWDWRYDDRAAVWLRYGAPDKRVAWTGKDSAQVLGRGARQHVLKGVPGGNAREAWLYRRASGNILLNFEVEDFSGTVEATRLVAGVLGQYLCDVDPVRCRMSGQSADAYSRFWQLGGLRLEPVSKEALARISQQDVAAIHTVLSSSIGASRAGRPLRVNAGFYRFRAPGPGVWRGFAVVAIRAQDVIRPGRDTTSTVELEYLVRQVSATGALLDSQRLVKGYRLPHNLPADAWITELLEVPPASHASEWGLSVRGPGESLGADAGFLQPIRMETDSLWASDLVLGSQRQGRSWQSPEGNTVWVAPLGAFRRDKPVSLYLQVGDLDPGAEYTLRLEVIPGEGPAHAELAIQFKLLASRPIEEILRTLDVSRLKPGSYELRVRVWGKQERQAVSRTAHLLILGSK